VRYFPGYGHVRHISQLEWLQTVPARRRRRRAPRPRWCLQWRTPIMKASAFGYFDTKAEALAAQARMQPLAAPTVRLHRR